MGGPVKVRHKPTLSGGSKNLRGVKKIMGFKEFLRLKLPAVYRILQIIWRRIRPTVHNYRDLILYKHDFRDFIKNLPGSKKINCQRIFL